MRLEKLSDKIVFSEESITKRVIFAEEKVLNFVLNLKSGQGIPPHKHEKSDLILHILTGEGEVTTDGDVTKVSKDDIIYMKGEELFSLKNTGTEDMSCFVVITPNPSPIYSKEI